jgi:hypothetical protein
MSYLEIIGIGIVAVVLALAAGFWWGDAHATAAGVQVLDAYKAKVEVAQAQAKQVNDDKINSINEQRVKDQNEYQAQISTRNGQLVAARKLLHDVTSDRDRLAAAASAPADCSGYAAPASRLSVSDADFLVGEAGRADSITDQLRACQREYSSLIERLNATH